MKETVNKTGDKQNTRNMSETLIVFTKIRILKHRLFEFFRFAISKYWHLSKWCSRSPTWKRYTNIFRFFTIHLTYILTFTLTYTLNSIEFDFYCAYMRCIFFFSNFLQIENINRYACTKRNVCELHPKMNFLIFFSNKKMKKAITPTNSTMQYSAIFLNYQVFFLFFF